MVTWENIRLGRNTASALLLIAWQTSHTTVYYTLNTITIYSPPLHARVQCTVKGDLLAFFFKFTIFHTASSAAPQIVSEDAGIEPRTVATLALAVRRSNLSARSYPQSRLDLVHTLG
jgi:hypothetical protein